ncbi:MAG: cytidine/deoxycytidylate deaminase family protein [Syntrophales bacterium]|nr:cytidine/deoxycytidylate deaminase family protein [Syntrophales bacterium]
MTDNTFTSPGRGTGQKTLRPDWDEYFMDIVELVARRSTCRRRAVGALLVRERRILTTGYNGAPTGMRHCVDIGCLREQLGIPSGERHELCRGLHAEQNALIQAALHGVSVKGATLYCTNHPCIICTKMLINGGIIRVVFREGYMDKMAEEMFQETGIKVSQL